MLNFQLVEVNAEPCFLFERIDDGEVFINSILF